MRVAKVLRRHFANGPTCMPARTHKLYTHTNLLMKEAVRERVRDRANRLPVIQHRNELNRRVGRGFFDEEVLLLVLLE